MTPLDRALHRAAWLFAGGSAIHLVDHLRRGQGSVADELYWLGNLGLVVQVAVITLVFARHQVAPLAAASAGPVLALGFLAAHWVPEWSAISDPVWEVTSLPALSYVASASEILGALAVGVVGGLILRRDGLASAVAPAEASPGAVSLPVRGGAPRPGSPRARGRRWG